MSMMKLVYYRIFTKILVLLISITVFLIIIHIYRRPKPEPTEFEKAANAVHWMIVPHNLSRSAFTVAFPEGLPSEFINYMFSDMGVAEWPPYEDSGEFSPEEIRAMRIPLIPKEIELVPLYPDPEVDKQLVIKFDDSRRMVIVEGYSEPKQEPVLVREWNLPRVEPDAGIENIYWYNYDMGMSDHAF